MDSCICCDDVLPEVKPTLAESIYEAKDLLLWGGKIIMVPLGAFAATCVFNYLINRKVS